MIVEKSGNLLLDDADGLVNTVNTVGIMGKGLALQFKRAFPENFRAYRAACDRNLVAPGSIFAIQAPDGRWILNFPTKRHWRERSRLQDVDDGLAALAEKIRELRLASIAIPPLGCGNGGLDWPTVRALIVERLVDLDCEIRLYSPGTPDPRAMIVHPDPPELDRRRVRLLRAVAAYAKASLDAGVSVEDATSLVEIHKTVYLLQHAGLDLGYQFDRGKYGPYSPGINRELASLEGHYLIGYGDGTGGARADLELLPTAENVRKFDDPEFDHAWRSVSQVIPGYEYPEGMELLTTVHFIATSFGGLQSPADIAERVTQWSDRKRRLFSPIDIHEALEHLRESALLSKR